MLRELAYSPDGDMIAVGFGGKFAKHKLSGKWLLLRGVVGNPKEDLSIIHEPAHTRFERVSDIKFNPKGEKVAVANADNGIDVYTIKEVNGRTTTQRICKFEGHSSFVIHVDWSADADKDPDVQRMFEEGRWGSYRPDGSKLQSHCGAHELLYWDTKTRKQVKSSSSMKDEEWDTQTCIYGWPVRGLWPEGADGTDINACTRSLTGERELVATADDFGKVKLFRYPCIVPQADCKPYSGHSSHVTNIGFTYDDGLVLSAGGEDRAVFQWRVVAE